MSELYRTSYRCLSAKLVPTFADRGCHVFSVTDPYGRILGFLDRSRYFFFQVASQLYSQGWVDPVPDPLLRKSGRAGNGTWTSGSVARTCDYYITEAVLIHGTTFHNSSESSEIHSFMGRLLWLERVTSDNPGIFHDRTSISLRPHPTNLSTVLLSNVTVLEDLRELKNTTNPHTYIYIYTFDDSLYN
jgi:hypothetical protein